DDGTRKNTGDGGWCHAVGPTTCKAVLLFGKSVRKPTGVLSGEWFLCVVLLCGKALKKRAFLVGARARDPCIYTIGNNSRMCYFGLAQWWRGFER
ncbi:hypothetical protein, partial [Escherichia coli]